MITRARDYLNDKHLPPMDMLQSVLKEHRVDFERMQHLRDIYNARNPILQRERRKGLPNNRIAHPYARYITTIATGYLIGKPVTYSVEAENETMQRIQDIFRRGSEAAENVQLARDASIYGKGVEYVHADENALPHTTAVSPLNAFVVYSNTFDMEPLFGVYYLPRTKADGSPDGWLVYVMSDLVIARYEAQSLDDLPSAIDEERHFFGRVPIVEYWNDENEKGDFEWVLSQIEAYDKLQSDRVNDKEQFVDRLLVLYGAVLEKDEDGRTPQEQLKEEHVLQMPDAQSKAEYLASAMDEAGNQILRKDLLEDIHKLALVPDMSDSTFASNASGVAIRYKLWCLEQLIRTKERWFTEGLRSRLRLYINFLTVKGFKALDVADIKITYTRPLPANMTENAQNVRNASEANAVSIETSVRMLHEGDEWTDAEVSKEVAAIRAERAEEAAATARADGDWVDDEGFSPAGDSALRKAFGLKDA